MVKIHNLGFPRIGSKRELKFALESFWDQKSSKAELENVANQIKNENLTNQSHLDFIPVGDFSFYDQVLDTSFALSHVPPRIKDLSEDILDNYFRVARGRAKPNDNHAIAAGEMTKWFDTNYHYIVPEVTKNTAFSANPEKLLNEINHAKKTSSNLKPVLIGPVTYLWLSKEKDGSNKLDLLDKLLPVYQKIIDAIEKEGISWIQIDEPVLVTELDNCWISAINKAYSTLKTKNAKILLATYFGTLKDNLSTLINLPVDAIHIDAIRGKSEVDKIIKDLPKDKILSLGVINGRNIWKTDLTKLLDWLEPIAKNLNDRLWLAPSCSLLHVPVDLSSETKIDAEILNWLAFAKQKLTELAVLKQALNEGRDSVKNALDENFKASESRRNSKKVHLPEVKNAVKNINQTYGERKQPYTVREGIQEKIFNLPLYPTTTIGSFPQTSEIRSVRLAYKKGEISQEIYEAKIKSEIEYAIREQEKLGLDVLVHGEAERNDMVEYFGEQLEGYVFSQFGWVQSYGSRCVKPPILFGDIKRIKPMTLFWSQYAQSLTALPMKGMLTGPVTILNWSFVRDDQPRKESCLQLALAIRDEVLDLEKAGIKIIQIDEAALREGLPLRRLEWQEYLDWAVESFRISANGVKDETQIHTHMCYSEFNDIIKSIAHMDADVITIETSRSDMELLEVFKEFNYPNQIGPGVYDIHTPNIPTKEEIINLIKKAEEHIPATKLWINPDCGLKTRRWEEVIPALKHMVGAAKLLREKASEI